MLKKISSAVKRMQAELTVADANSVLIGKSQKTGIENSKFISFVSPIGRDGKICTSSDESGSNSNIIWRSDTAVYMTPSGMLYLAKKYLKSAENIDREDRLECFENFLRTSDLHPENDCYVLLTDGLVGVNFEMSSDCLSESAAALNSHYVHFTLSFLKANKSVQKINSCIEIMNGESVL